MQQQLRQQKEEKSLSGGDEGGIERLKASSKRLQVQVIHIDTLTSTTVKKSSWRIHPLFVSKRGERNIMYFNIRLF